MRLSSSVHNFANVFSTMACTSTPQKWTFFSGQNFDSGDSLLYLGTTVSSNGLAGEALSRGISRMGHLSSASRSTYGQGSNPFTHQALPSYRCAAALCAGETSRPLHGARTDTSHYVSAAAALRDHPGT
eukprot:5603746-Amphidinium_carterae.1